MSVERGTGANSPAIRLAERAYLLRLQAKGWRENRPIDINAALRKESEAADIEAVLASLQAPCPGKAGERDKVKALVSAFAVSFDRGCTQSLDAVSDAILALLSAQPVPSEDQGSLRPIALPEAPPHVFLDCDGVLADFDAHGMNYFGMQPRQAEAELGAKEFWRQLKARGDFYRSMPLMPDARELYEGVAHLSPTILTGCPRGNWAQGQKVAWAREHFPGVPIITCRSADKRDHAKPGDVLIDDWPQHRHRWIEFGGVFISHYDAKSSLSALWAQYPTLQQASKGGSELKNSLPDSQTSGGGAKVCVMCGVPNADPRSWDAREPKCPDCQDGRRS